MNAEEHLQKLVELTEEQVRWQRASVLSGVKHAIEQALSTSQLREAYELCDGKTQAGDVAKAVKTSPASLSEWTKRWRDIGIAYEVEGKRTKHLATLKSLGLPVKLEDTPTKRK